MKTQFMLIDTEGDQVWYLDTEDRSDDVLSGSAWVTSLHLHRTDGPASVWADGSQWWYLNGKRHRTDGPAVITAGRQSWYLNGIRYWGNKSFQEAAKLTDEEMMIMIIKYGDVTY